MTAKHKIGEVASLLGISSTTIYKKVGKLKDKLEGHVSKDSGSLVFDETAISILRDEIPAAKKDTALALPQNEMADLKKALLLLADDGKQTRNAMTQLVERNAEIQAQLVSVANELRAVRAENSIIRKLLSAPPAPEKVITLRADRDTPPAKKEPTFSENLHKAVLEVQAGMRDILAPFLAVFKG